MLSSSEQSGGIGGRSAAPVLAEVAWGGDRFSPLVDWFFLGAVRPLEAALRYPSEDGAVALATREFSK